jgi:hypothetical protein
LFTVPSLAILQSPSIILAAAAFSLQYPLQQLLHLYLVKAVAGHCYGKMLITIVAQLFTIARSCGTGNSPTVPRTTLLSLPPSRGVRFSMVIKETPTVVKISPPDGGAQAKPLLRIQCSLDGSTKKRTWTILIMATTLKWGGRQPNTLDVVKKKRITKTVTVLSKFAGTLLLVIAMSVPRLSKT